jgi:AcrR family transcriptional regulator
MTKFAAIAGCTRKEPCQQRGEDRVETLLAAAIEEFSAAGYEAATMSSIAARARASIGSLYQFFPNKEAVARALRTRQIGDAEREWRSLAGAIEPGDVAGFVDRFVPIMTGFVDQHPAFLPLLDAPSSTVPSGARSSLRLQMSRILVTLHPMLRPVEADRIAEAVLNINKAMMGLFARSAPKDRAWITVEYRAVLGAYLSSRPAPRPPGPAARRKGRA